MLMASKPNCKEMHIFLAIIIQIGHNMRDTLEDHWLTAEQFYKPFYSNTVKCN